MNTWMIYKTIVDEKTGMIKNAETMELYNNEKEAQRFAKLYNLQVPFDLRTKTMFQYIRAHKMTE